MDGPRKTTFLHVKVSVSVLVNVHFCLPDKHLLIPFNPWVAKLLSLKMASGQIHLQTRGSGNWVPYSNCIHFCLFRLKKKKENFHRIVKEAILSSLVALHFPAMRKKTHILLRFKSSPLMLLRIMIKWKKNCLIIMGHAVGQFFCSKHSRTSNSTEIKRITWMNNSSLRTLGLFPGNNKYFT